MTEPDPCPARCGVPVNEHTDDDRALCGEATAQKARDERNRELHRLAQEAGKL